ncbi:hypothetical protein CcaCcLH18_11997 [Colletotrichum camelliae]|nr:hypothetical protein CcaCcLH18_11997 [Colletotrichum camelliae]
MAELTYDEILASDLFKFVVGAEHRTHLHSTLVARQSKALHKLLYGSMKEAQERSVQWLDVDVPTFVRFGEFIYTGDYHAAPYTSRDVSDSVVSDVLPAEPAARIARSPSFIKSKKVATWNPKPSAYLRPANESLWSEFSRLYADFSPANVRENGPSDDYTDVFLGHAKVYVFADCYGIAALRALSLGKLRKTLEVFALHQAGVQDVIRLIRYCYQNTADRMNEEDELRTLVNMYTACKVETLWEDADFAGLVETNGEYAKGLVNFIARRQDLMRDDSKTQFDEARFEPMVSGYEARGRGGEAWQLTQDTFEAHRANMTLAAPSITPWIERMISGYEARGRGDEAWQLIQDTFEAHRANMPLTVPALPSDATITLETGEPFHVRKEVLQFWSTYFSGAFRHDWGKEITFSEEIICEQSWAAVLDFMYNGKYTVPDDEEQAWRDWQAADYLGILAVLTKLEEAAWLTPHGRSNESGEIGAGVEASAESSYEASAYNMHINSKVPVLDDDAAFCFKCTIEALGFSETLMVKDKVQGDGSALQTACAEGFCCVAWSLILDGADVNDEGGWYGNGLQGACAEGHGSIAQMLLANGAKVNAAGGHYNTALQAACAEGYSILARKLLDQGAEINATGGHYGSALQATSLTGRRQIVQLLLDRNANPNAGGGSYGSPLAAASFGGHVEIVNMLLEAGAEINAKRNSRSALQVACWEGYGDIAKILVGKGADIHAHHEVYGDALQAASYKGYTEVVRMLLDEGANIRAPGGWFGDAVHAAMAGFNTETRQVLLAHAMGKP